MRNLTIKMGNHFFNYDNVSEIRFIDNYRNVQVWTAEGKYTEMGYPNQKSYDYAKEKLEEGLINGFVFIDLNMPQDAE